MNNTNTRIWLLAATCAIVLCPALQSQTFNSGSDSKHAGSSAKSKKRTVKQLDGTKLFGFVEVTDDYTIRVSNDWGIIRLPIAELGDGDFRKYGLKKDRSNDGRFWYERKKALEEAKQSRTSAKRRSVDKSGIEIRLAEISAFEPVIAAYEKTLPPKDDEKSGITGKPGDKTGSGKAALRTILSQPSSVASLSQTLSGSATARMQSVADVAGLPSAP